MNEMFTKRKVEKHKKKMQQILNNEELSVKEKGFQLVNAFNEMRDWFFKDEKYENEAIDIIKNFCEQNNFSLGDLL